MRAEEQVQEERGQACEPVFGPAPHRADPIARLLVLGVYLASVALPLAWIDRPGVILCAVRRWTGLPCPACGLTHAFVCLGHGRIADSLHYNALGLPLFLLGILWLSREVFDKRGTWPRLSPRASVRAAALGAVLVLVYGIFRILVPSARPF